MYFSCDIGATKTRIASSTDCVAIKDVSIYRTPKKFKDGVDKLIGEIHKIANGKKINGICVGVPGPLDKDKTMILNSPNLELWRRKPLKRKIEEEFKCRVLLENDAALVGLGEAVYGEGKKYNIVAYITISTGVNGVKVVNKSIEENAYGFEIGHQIVLFGNKKPTYIERLIGGRWIYQNIGKRAEYIKNEKIWNDIHKVITVLVNNTLCYWSPEIIIIGGGISKSIKLRFIKKELKKISIFPFLPEIAKAKLGDKGGLYGGFYFLSKFAI